MQRNWIGRSEGATFSFEVEGLRIAISVFTTRIDTLFGVTYLALAPEHPIVAKISSRVPKHANAVEAFAASVRNQSELERTSLMEKAGVPNGRIRAQSALGRAHPDLGDQLRAGRLWHRRGHGRARARRARLRVRP